MDAAVDYIRAAPRQGLFCGLNMDGRSMCAAARYQLFNQWESEGHSRLRERAGKRKSRQALMRPKGFLEMSGQWWLPRHFLWGGPMQAMAGFIRDGRMAFGNEKRTWQSQVLF